jgi:hypothetical protein
MQEDGFRSTAEVERSLSFVASELRDIALELRNVVASACPFATERILWRGLSYHDSRRGGPVKGAICQIELESDHVRLSFVHGARLAHPGLLLRGDRLSKRYVEIRSYDDAPWEALRQLIEGAAKLGRSEWPPLSGGQSGG